MEEEHLFAAKIGKAGEASLDIGQDKIGMHLTCLVSNLDILMAEHAE
jgi:hypothetical protein